MPYICPYSMRKPNMQYIICKQKMKPDKRYFTPTECAEAACLNAYYCTASRRYENTDGARKCGYNPANQTNGGDIK